MAHAVRIKLEIFGQPRDVVLNVPAANIHAHELLPALQTVADSVVRESAAASAKGGKPVACAAGCGACCRQFVRISTAEAIQLAQYVESLPAEKQTAVRGRFAEALARSQEAGLVGPPGADGKAELAMDVNGLAKEEAEAFFSRYFRLGIACPFLENESCSVYPVRPLICREYCVVSSPEHCAALDVEKIEVLESRYSLSVRMPALLEYLGVPEPRQIPLLFALQWYAAHTSADMGKCEAGSMQSIFHLLSA